MTLDIDKLACTDSHMDNDGSLDLRTHLRYGCVHGGRNTVPLGGWDEDVLGGLHLLGGAHGEKGIKLPEHVDAPRIILSNHVWWSNKEKQQAIGLMK